MFYALLTLHVFLCASLVGLVLLQQGKGADMGAAFGAGGSNTLFGATGADRFIVRLTTGIAVAVMATTILLVNSFNSLEMTTVTAAPVSNPILDKLEESANSVAPAVEEASEASAPKEAAPSTEKKATE